MPRLKDVKIIFYDLGLHPAQRQELEQYCRCEVRSFPFQDYPSHMRNLMTYTWKPIIVYKTLLEFGSVWWVDSCVRFLPERIPEDISRAVEYARNNGPLAFTNTISLTVARHTDLRTMSYLKEDPCKFRKLGELEANFNVYFWNNITKVMIRSCMAPPEAKLRCDDRDPSDGRCHRFDQAVLSMMIRRLYHDKHEYPNIHPPLQLRVLNREEKIKYFPEPPRSSWDWFRHQ